MALADYLLGYTVSADKYQQVRWGSQPYEAYLSEVCEAFTCTPSEAEAQDRLKVRRIFEYRNIKTALDLFNEGSKGRQELAKHPQLIDLLVEMHRAQQEDEAITWADVLTLAPEDEES